MKSILQNIFEASGKPSDLKKYKRTERKETVHFRSGDMFDTKDPGYDDEFSYFDGSGNGYIKDKAGHVYDVIATDRAGDAGAIAGGSHDYFVTIKKANGKDDFRVHGWTAIMSSGSNTECISDIKAGYYLEDYIAKYWSKYDDKDGKFKELAEKGDKNAKAYADQKAEKLQQKKTEFDTRYISIPERFSWEIIDGKFNVNNLNLTSGSIKELENKRSKWLKQNHLESWEDYKAGDNPEFAKMVEEISTKSKELRQTILDVLMPVLLDRLQKVFKTKDLKSLSGLTGSFVYDHKIAKGKNFGYIKLAIDTKKKEFVFKDEVNHKIVDSDIELQLNDNIGVFRDKASDKMLELFKKVSEAWKKSEGRKQTQYIADNWERIQKESGGYWKYNKTQSQAKADAKAEFQQICRDHDFGNVSKNRFEYSLALVQVYVEGDMEPEGEPVEKPLENPEPKEKKERGKDTKMSKSANAAAYDKMKAWHEGTRKQNLSNCSDAKLKMNYKVCKELGYEAEMKKIEDEAKKRDIVLESISLNEYIIADNEIDD